MENINYAGGYLGFDSLMGYTLSVYRPNGMSGHFMRMMGRFYFVNTGWNEAEGTHLTTKIRPLLQRSCINIERAVIIPGVKLVYNNSGSWSGDYAEYLVFTHDTFWDNKNFEEPPVDDDGAVPEEWAEKLRAIFEQGKETVDNSPEKQEATEKKKQKASGNGSSGDVEYVGGTSEPREPKPEPPFMLVYEPPEILVIGDPPYDGGEDAPEKQKKGRWRRKRKQEEVPEGFIDDAEDCEELEPADPVDESIEQEEGSPIRRDNRVHFRYVFALHSQVWVGSYYANVYAFIGVNGKGEVIVLPTFVSAETGKNVPWHDFFKVLKTAISGIDYFVYKDYDHIVEGHLKEIFPSAIYLHAIWDLSAEALFKKRAEEIHRVFEKEVKNFWYNPGAMEATPALQDTVERFMQTLEMFFAGYEYQSELDLPKVMADSGEIDHIVADGTGDNITASVEEAEAGQPEEQVQASAPVNYCFVYEVEFAISGGGRQRIPAFNQVTDGNVVKTVLAALPLNIGDTLWSAPSDSAWEEAITKAVGQLASIKYLLFRDCSVNTWTLNKSILPDTIWCGNIADVEYTEPSREINIEKMKALDEHFSSGNSAINKNCETTEQSLETLAEYVKANIMPEVETVI